MIALYSDYLSQPQILSLEEMERLHADIAAGIGADPDALELYHELVETATRYASFRAGWCLWDRSAKAEKDPGRTSCHNSVIIKFNQLARYLKMQGRDAAWRDAIGYEEDDPIIRKRIGDFACYIVFINSILAR